MNILYLAFSDISYDGRTKALLRIMSVVGDTEVVYYSKKASNIHNIHVVQQSSWGKQITFIKFVFFCIKVASNMKQIDCLFIDNYHATLPGLIISIIKVPKIIIQDMRELYEYKNFSNVLGKFLCFFERTMLKKADLIICANAYRAAIVEKRNSIRKRPLVYENIRLLDYSPFKRRRITDKTIRIVATDGTDFNRCTMKLIAARRLLPQNIEIIIIGEINKNERKIIVDYVNKHNLIGINILPKVPLNELKEIISKCDIGIVKYHQKDLNNKFCASGKIYEFLSLGIPVVTTSNLPLKELCDKYGIGEADDDFYSGIGKVINNYDYYVDNIAAFMHDISEEQNDNALKVKLQSEFEEHGF